MPLSRLHRIGLSALIGLALCVLYGSVGVATAQRDVTYTLETPLDAFFPVWPAWIAIYLLVFFQALAPLATLTDARVFRRTIGAYLALYVVGTPFWIFYPVEMIRPDLPVTDLWTFGVALTRRIDPPTNCMPSMHVALGFLSALVVRRHDRSVGNLLLLSSTAILVSTLVLDQHWLLDCILALAITWAVAWAAFDLKPLPNEVFSALPRRWHATWVLLYALVFAVAASGWWFGWIPVESLPPIATPWN